MPKLPSQARVVIVGGGVGGCSITYGYLPVEYAEIGTQLEVEIFEERIKATVEREPPCDPKGKRIRT